MSKAIMARSKLLCNINKIINHHNQHVNVPNGYNNEAHKNYYIKILNLDNQSTQSTCQCPK